LPLLTGRPACASLHSIFSIKDGTTVLIQRRPFPPQLVLCALGIDVSLEKRGGDVLVDLLAVSVAGLFVGGTAIWTAVLLVMKAKPRTHTKKWVMCIAAAVLQDQQRVSSRLMSFPYLLQAVLGLPRADDTGVWPAHCHDCHLPANVSSCSCSQHCAVVPGLPLVNTSLSAYIVSALQHFETFSASLSPPLLVGMVMLPMPPFRCASAVASTWYLLQGESVQHAAVQRMVQQHNAGLLQR
jgi:hypothetical protein